MELSKKELAILIGVLGDVNNYEIKSSLRKSSEVKEEDRVLYPSDEPMNLYSKLIKLYNKN